MKSAKRTEVNRKKTSPERAAYKLDYTKARPNRFANRGSSNWLVVLLDPDVAKVFKSAEAVNSALRAILNVVPH